VSLVVAEQYCTIQYVLHDPLYIHAIIKLTKETRRRFWRLEMEGSEGDGLERKRLKNEGVKTEETIHCFSLL